MKIYEMKTLLESNKADSRGYNGKQLSIDPSEKDSKGTGGTLRPLRHPIFIKGARKSPEALRDFLSRNNLSESYSDYELYQILESNGYTTTKENLSILKEGLETGKYIIE